MISAMSNKEFVLSVFDKNTPSNLVVENILSRTGLDSVSWSNYVDSLMKLYSWLCKQYGLKDELSNKPKVTFL